MIVRLDVTATSPSPAHAQDHKVQRLNTSTKLSCQAGCTQTGMIGVYVILLSCEHFRLESQKPTLTGIFFMHPKGSTLLR